MRLYVNSSTSKVSPLLGPEEPTSFLRASRSVRLLFFVFGLVPGYWLEFRNKEASNH